MERCARLPLVVLACLALAANARAADPAAPHPIVTPAMSGAVPLPNGLALPYPTLRVFRAFGKCKGAGKRPERWQGAWRSHDHEGIDLGGLGPDGGLGSAVRSMTRAKVTEIVHGDDLPAKYGVTDLRPDEVDRDGTLYPRSFALPGYGMVWFFTRQRGWYRTGNMVVTVGVDEPPQSGVASRDYGPRRLAGHRIRYMHLGHARPGLKVGDIVEPGEELGVLGGTGVQEDAPHLHLDIRDPDGESVDVAPLIGLVTSAWCGVPRKTAVADFRAFKAAAAGKAWRPDRWAPPVGDPSKAIDAPDPASPFGGRVPGSSDVVIARALGYIDLLRTPAPLVETGIVPASTRFWHDVIVARPCGPTIVEEDFSTGAYGGHAWRMRALKGQAFELSVTHLRGAGGPTFALIDQTAERVVHPAAAQPSTGVPAIAVTPVTDPQRVHFEAINTTDVLIAVLQQPEPYRITVTERCKLAN